MALIWVVGLVHLAMWCDGVGIKGYFSGVERLASRGTAKCTVDMSKTSCCRISIVMKIVLMSLPYFVSAALRCSALLYYTLLRVARQGVKFADPTSWRCTARATTGDAISRSQPMFEASTPRKENRRWPCGYGGRTTLSTLAWRWKGTKKKMLDHTSK